MQKGAAAVAVVVTNPQRAVCLLWLAMVAVLAMPWTLQAAVLPEDRVDMLYHGYDGGGMDIDGPSVLVRKSIGQQFSLSGQYYVDSVSAASVDVLATASEYTEERTEYSAGVDFLNDKTLMSLNYINSSENDFDAESIHFSISQDVFGDLTTVNLGYSAGWDEVGMVDSDFSEDASRQNYRLGVSQILTRNWIMGLNMETITDEGFLNNPYRQVRYRDENSARGFEYQSEVYPESRTSTAYSLTMSYFLPYRAAMKMEYRYFTDTWGIEANNVELGYVHPFGNNWVAEVRVRWYDQKEADFYSDLFPFQDAQSYLARDKELSRFSSMTYGAGITYTTQFQKIPGVDRLVFGLLMDFMEFDYDNFRDVTQTGYAVGEEPLYSFDATVTRAYLTVFY